MSSQESFKAFAKARRRMIDNDLKGRGITASSVLKVMGELGREEFVPETYESQAYADGPLPIGCGQTISQPYIVALMTQELRVDGNCTVLEIGTGCGYQTAVLSRLAKKVYTVERFGQLSESAQATLGRLGVENVEFFVGDGSGGWPEKKIFDRIMVTAAVPAVPGPLLEQLATGGLIVAPVGGQSVQRLIVCEKKPVGVVEKAICEVRFVRLIGEYGFSE